MRLVIFMFAIFTTGCHTGDGTLTGKVTDVTWEGMFFDSCEVGVQYGDQSSRVEFVSSRDRGLCNDIEKLIGKSIMIRYHKEAISFTTNHPEQIVTFTEVKND